jgi:glycine cleavage system regulatory protein
MGRSGFSITIVTSTLERGQALMNSSLIVTLIGPDRPGLVRAVAARAKTAGANWVESRMAQLAGQFAGIVRLEIAPDQVAQLENALRSLEAEGLRVTVERGLEGAEAALQSVRLDLVGHDRPGIVQEITEVLLRHGATIEGLETGCERASMSGERMFRAHAELGVPAGTDLHHLQDDLESLANELMVDLELHPEPGATGSD